MDRSNYSEDCYGWDLIRWRGAVAQSIRSKRGQAFLKELLTALDAMPVKELVRGELVTPQGEVCAMGSVLVRRGVDAKDLDEYDYDQIASIAGVAPALVREIEFINDDCYTGRLASEHGITEGARRYSIVRQWVKSNIRAEA